ncbi:MAG TPA: error-prone DNA polymerase [Rhodanobacteraceae bacterium]|nr:error-prone DNA polymerase [Rhodanobacteraceae bacterium]
MPDTTPPPDYAELHCLSNFSFQRGASSADELFQRAATLGYRALAITDECTLAGIVRAFEAAREHGVDLIVGSEIQLDDGPKLVLLVESQAGYSELCRLITIARRRSAKGSYCLQRADLETLQAGVLALWTPSPVAAVDANAATLDEHGAWLTRHFAGRAWLAVELHRGPDDVDELAARSALAERHGLPLVASGDVHMHVRRRRALQDLLTAIRLHTTVAAAGHALFPNGERHLRTRVALARIHPSALMEASVRIAERCRFKLDQLRYEYPHELVPAGSNPTAHLRQLTLEGARTRWPQGVPEHVSALVEKELTLIASLDYEPFFLTVHDIVAFARSRGILCQGRGSAANSAVCFCLGITAVDPSRSNMLFERFISKERDEPPDIDVDFEHERREEVLQYVFSKYGRERAALAATVITWRGKSAARDVGRALGLDENQLDQLSRAWARGGDGAPIEERLRERGFDPDSRVMRQLVALVNELRGFPRHLSQHVGGFVISEAPLHHLVPVENAAMDGRTIIQWDKDDLETMRLLKVDCLALGMLTCLRKCFDLLRAHRGLDLGLASIPADDPPTWAMVQRADTIGVFQIESRAQMSMLPRLKPRCFYDLVIEVAIMRPGPIEGGMVHPYLRRRNGEEPIDYPSPAVRTVLERTCGVPIFQEQVMALLQVTADFTPGEADQLRRSMAAWKRRGGLEKFERRIFDGMARNGYSAEYAAQVFAQIKGFGSYGFPESHAASFALLVYASAWLKCRHPAVFGCALLNSQPMGFYAPAQIVRDLRQHGVEVRAADVVASDWDCTLEPAADNGMALRLGLRQVNGLGEDTAARIVAARQAAPLRDLADLSHRAALNAGERARLAEAGALQTLSGHRYRARWDSAGIERGRPLLDAAAAREARVELRVPALVEDIMADYASLGLSLRRHPLALVRPSLRQRRCRSAAEVATLVHGTRLRHAGLVLVRQQPHTNSGVTFVTLEDEDGQVNVVVWRDVALRHRRTLLEAKILAVDGVLEASHGVRHLIARRLHDYSDLLPMLAVSSRNFH